jgi:hypothetical protein
MAGNVYDETLEDLEPPQVAPANPYLAIIDQQQQANERGLRQATAAAQASTPERTAEAIRIGRQLGLPVDVVERNFDEIKKRAALEGSPYAEMVRQTPALVEWAQEPENMKVAADDLEQLGFLEWMLTAPQRSFSQGVNQVRFGQLKTESIFRTLTREEQDQLNAYKFHMQAGGEFGAGTSWFRKAVVGGYGQVPNLFGASLYALKYGAVGAAGLGAGGALVGSVVPGVGTVAGALAGGRLGFQAGVVYGAGKFGFEIEAGNALDEYEQFHDEHGQPLDPAVARAAAIATGALNAGLEAFSFQILLKSIPGLNKLSALAVRQAVKKALTIPTVRAGLADAMKSYAGTLTWETATEVAQRAVTIMSGELGKAASGQDIERRKLTEPSSTGAPSILEDLGQEAVGALQAFAFTVAGGPLLSAAHAQSQARRAQQGQAFFTALGQGVTGSKTFQRLPEAAQTFVARVTKDGPLEHVYAPVESWITYWQSQGLDPAAVASEVTGQGDALAVAQRTGEDLVIPTARYATAIAGTPHNAFFARELRFAPGEMNAREGEAFEAALTETAEAEAVPGEDRAAAVREAVIARLVEASTPVRVAERYADLYASAFEQVAAIEEVDPRDVYRQYGFAVTREAEAAPAAPAVTGPTPTEAAAPLGTVVAPTTEGLAASSAPGAQLTAIEPEIPGLAALEADLGGATIEQVEDAGTGINAAGESAASREAIDRQAAMQAAGQTFGVYDRAGRFRRLADVSAQDYVPVTGETFGILSPTGFQVLTENGGRVPLDTTEDVANIAKERHAEPVAAPPAGPVVRDRGGERGAPDTERRAEAARDELRLEPVELPAPDPDEIFSRKSAKENARRFTPEVLRELDRIFDELESFPFIPHSWSWLGPGEQHTGNAAGGKANIVGGAAGAEVYHDILAFAPVGRVTHGRRKGQPAKAPSGSRNHVRGVVAETIKTKDIQTGLAEGAVRVAERRAVGDHSVISLPYLPPSWGRIVDDAFTNAVSDAITDDLEATNLLDEASMEADILEPEGPVDTSFNVDEFYQSLFDEVTPDTGVETLTTPTTDRPQQPAPAAEPPARKVRKGSRVTFQGKDYFLAKIYQTHVDLQEWAYHERGFPLVSSGFLSVPIRQFWKGHQPGPVAVSEVLFHGDERAGLQVLTAERPEGLPIKGDSSVLGVFFSATPLAAEHYAGKGGAVYQATVTGDLYELSEKEFQGLDSVAAFRARRERLKQAGYVGVRIPHLEEVAVWDQAAIVMVGAAAEPTQADVLDTGELQPRLPGDVGAVRDLNVPTPEFELPFALTAQVARRAGKQTTLFQPVYHGTAAKFEAFSLHAIGTGEGAQAYGWGLYFSSLREIAETYRKSLAGPGQEKSLALDGERIFGPQVTALYRDFTLDATLHTGILELYARVYFEPPGKAGIARIRQSVERAIANLTLHAQAGTTWSGDRNRDKFDLEKNQAALHVLDTYGDRLDILPAVKTGRVYKVEIPEDDDFLSWDLAASRQSPKVQAALQALGLTWTPDKTPTLRQAAHLFETKHVEALAREDVGIRETLREGRHYVLTADEKAFDLWYQRNAGLFRARGRLEPTGEGVYEDLLARVLDEELAATPPAAVATRSSLSARAEQASRRLNSVGIAGIRYLDGYSRSKAEGTQNYVVFDDRLVQITEFYQRLEPARQLTTADVQAWANDLKARTGPDLEALDLYLTVQGDLKLDVIAIRRGAARAGLGGRVMQELTRYADRNGLRIVLTLAPKGYQPIAGGVKTTSKDRLARFYRRFGFVRNAGRHMDYSLTASMYREPTIGPTLPSTVSGQLRTESPAFRNWFGRSQVVDDTGAPLRVYHGTTQTFTEFDRTRANLESDFGRGFYFSNNPRDVEENYAGIGPDLENKIERRIDELAREEDIAYNDVETRKGLRARAEEEFLANQGSTMAVFLKLENPAILGGDGESWLDMTQATDEEGEFLDVEPTGTLIDFIAALRDVASQYEDGTVDGVILELLEEAGYETLKVRDALEVLRKNEQFGYYTERLPSGHMASNEIVRLALQCVGFDGIIDRTVDLKFGSHRRVGKAMAGVDEDTVHYIAFEPTQIKNAIGNRGTYDPMSPSMLEQEKRGAIRFGADRQFTIALLEKADLSTFLHETGHFFLEIMGDLAERLETRDPSALTDRQRRFLGDYHGALEHLGAARREDLTEAQHEEFARTFEAYLLEGRAPSLALEGAFASFRAWLLGVYRSLINLHVRLTPEVTAIFDRLLASDLAIAQAEQRRGVPAMFTTADTAGMTVAQFGLYRETVARASRTARQQLDAKLLAEVRREQEESWKAQRDEIRTEVEAEVYARREYRALSAVLRGTHPNGDALVEGLETKPLRLSRALIVQTFGEARLKRLPRFSYVKDAGVDPETVAGMFGYTSADELLTALEDVAPMRQVIEQQTTARMLHEHGSMLLDGTLGEIAQAAVANEDRDSIIRAELRALTQLKRTVAPFERAGEERVAAERRERAYERRWFEAEGKLRVAIATGRKQVEIDQLQDEVRNLRQKARGGPAVIAAAIPPAALIQRTARARIVRMKIGQIKPALFWSASRRAGQQAIDHAARQDFDGAIAAKQQELLNLALYREAERTLEDIAIRVRFAKDLNSKASRARLGLAGQNYQDQVDGILDAYEFARVPAKALERRGSLAKFLAGLEAAGLPVPDALPVELQDEARRTNYQNLTVEELVGITDGLKMIVHLARLKNKLLKAQDEREFAEVRTAIVESIRTHSKVSPLPLEFTAGDEVTRRASDWFASHTKIAQLAAALDGYVDGGPMWRYIIKPINDATDAETRRNAEAGGAYTAILERFYTSKDLSHFATQRFIPAIGASLSKEARLSLALNWGNQTSRDRILADPRRKWGLQQVAAILETLDKRDWDFVQATWDFLDGFWPEIVAKQERVVGVAPEKVEALTVQTAFGDYRGGYYPLMYDPRLNLRSQQLEAASEARGILQAAYVSNTTKRGHIETRKAHVKLSVRLDLGVVFQHVQQVLHDLTHHEMLLDAQRILRDSSVSNAIFETKGDIVYQQFTRMLQDIALGNINGRRATILDRAATFARQGTQLSVLGLNLWTAVQQPLGVFNGMARVGPVWVARGIKRWLRDAAHLESTIKWIYSVSPMMKYRLYTQTQDLSDLRLELRRAGGFFDRLVRKVSFDTLTQTALLDGYMFHIGLAQRVADVPTWLGMYEKTKAGGGTEAEAIALADQAVLDSQGAGQLKDLAQVQRGGPVARLFMVFYTYGNTVFNQTARELGKTNYRSPVEVLEMLGNLSLIYVMPAFLTIAMSRAFGRTGGDDDDSWVEFVKNVGQEILSTALNTMVLVRELGGLVGDGTRGYAGPAGARLLQLAYQTGTQVKQGELDEAFFKSINQTGGIVFRYPAAQVERTVRGVIALEEGRTTSPAAVLFGPKVKGAK